MATKKSSSTGLLSDRYASALYDLATEENCIKKVIKDLELISNYYNYNKDFSLLLTNPLISIGDKLEIFNYILNRNNAHELIINFIKVVAKNKRFSLLKNIIKRFIDINAEKRGDIIAEIISARDLNKIQKNIIQKQLRTKLGEKLSIYYKIDKSIIGGLIIKFGSIMIDSSLNTKISKLKLAMKGA